MKSLLIIPFIFWHSLHAPREAKAMKGKRASSSKDNDGDDEKRQRLVSELAGTHGCSKEALANILKRLHDRGFLKDLTTAHSMSSYRRAVKKPFEEIAFGRPTNYGSLLQWLALPNSDHSVPYINPFAFLSVICKCNLAFFTLLKGLTLPLKLIIYLDEINPGNPLAPDPQRLVQAVYWTFADFPSFFLARKDSWFVFTIFKTMTIKQQLQGYISEMAKLILKVFFPDGHGTSFKSGCHFHNENDYIVVTASFKGFLGDEKALKEIFDIKGQARSVPCPSCLNARNRWVATDGTNLQKFWDPNLDGRIAKTHGHHTAIADRLRQASTKTERNSIETKTGVNFNPFGILFDLYLMSSVITMPSAYIRDWMHTLVSNGVAGTHLAAICAALAAIGISIDIVQAYCKQFHLPKHRGSKPSDLYFKDNLVDGDNVRHFAGDVLGMVTIMWAFLKDKIEPRGLLPDNLKCFQSLYKLMCTLRRGEIDTNFLSKFQAEVLKHATAFIQLYGDRLCKIKFHHLYHLAYDLYLLGRCISCFPGERRNKDALSVTNATDRSMENAAVKNFLHKTVLFWEDQEHCAKPRHMISPSGETLFGDRLVRQSTQLIMECGHIWAKDMVYLKDGSICRVIDFWEIDNELFCKGSVHDHVSSLYFATIGNVCFVSVDIIVEPISWYENSERGYIVAAVPDFV